MSNLKLILASTSNGRKNLLSTLKIPFEVVDSGVDEDKIWGETGEEVVLKRAEAKGKTVEKIVKNRVTPPKGCHPDISHQNYLIIAADSMVVLDNYILGKAKSKDQEKDYLKILAGKTHRFLTAVWIKNTVTGKVWTEVFESLVTIRNLNSTEIENYTQSDDLSKYAGAYSITNSPQDFVTKIEGSITNVIGLPLEILLPVLKENHLIN